MPIEEKSYPDDLIDYVQVLNHGFVRLVDWMGDDMSIIKAARVSYAADWRTGEEVGKDENLMRYMMRNGHTSPFEHVVFTFEVQAPIFVFCQWHRHRTQSYNEVSARYTELDMGDFLPAVDTIKAQDQKNKQGRAWSEQTSFNPTAVLNITRDAMQTCRKAYEELIAMGVARETYSRMFTTVNLHNLFHFLDLRTGAHAQDEIRVYAQAIETIISQIVPVAFKALQDRRAGTL